MNPDTEILIDPIFSTSPNDSVQVAENERIVVSDDGGTGVTSLGAGSEIDIDGIIDAMGVAAGGAFAAGGQVSLSGSINVSGDFSFDPMMGPNSASGITVVRGDASATIEDTGVIELSGIGSAGIIALDGALSTNRGTIEATADDTVGILNLSGGETINTGTISLSGVASQGILTFSGASIINEGTIITTGETLSDNAAIFFNGSAAIDLIGASNTVLNSGTIMSEHDAGIDARPFIGLGVNTITNTATGLIQGTVGIDGSDGVEVVENAGQIVGDVLLRGGDDTYRATDGGQVSGIVDGGGGNDTLIGGDGDDTLAGGGGVDVIDGGSGNDTNSFQGINFGVTASLNSEVAVYVTAGGVVVERFTNIENLSGSEFNDRLTGDSNDNSLAGNDGDDVLRGAGGNDNISGDAGNDVVFAGSGNDTISGGSGDDRIFARNGNDDVDAGDGDDFVIAGGGNDNIALGSGDDRVFAGSGNDTIDAGAGDDILSGGAGNDVFVFTNESGANTITDFGRSGGDDLIDLEAFGFEDINSVLGAAEQDGRDVVITLDDDTSITLQNTSLSSLDASDFLF